MKRLVLSIWFAAVMVINTSPSRAETDATTDDAGLVECRYCKGMGRLVDVSTTKKTGYECTICNGSGKIKREAENPCPHCDGLKRVPMVMPDAGIAEVQAPVTNKRSGVISARLIGQDCPMCNGSGKNRKAD